MHTDLAKCRRLPYLTLVTLEELAVGVACRMRQPVLV